MLLLPIFIEPKGYRYHKHYTHILAVEYCWCESRHLSYYSQGLFIQFFVATALSNLNVLYLAF